MDLALGFSAVEALAPERLQASGDWLDPLQAALSGTTRLTAAPSPARSASPGRHGPGPPGVSRPIEANLEPS